MKPTKEQLLLLEVVRRAELRRRSRIRIRDLAAVAQPAAFAAEAARQRLTSVVAGRLAEAGAADFEAAWTGHAGGTFRREALHGVALEMSSAAVVRALARAGIAATLLKGPRLSEQLYGGPGVRPSSDVDVLVRPRDLDTAVRVLVSLGYAPPRDPRSAEGLPDLHYQLVRPGRPVVELHWRIHWYESGLTERILRQAKPSPRQDAASDATTVAALLLFYARDGYAGLRPAADIAQWWDRHRTEASRASPVLHDIIVNHPELARALRVSALVAERVAGIPASALIGASSQRDRRSATIALGVADWRLEHSVTQRQAQAALVDGLLGPPGGAWAFVRRQLLPSRDVLRFQSDRDDLRVLQLTASQALYGPRRVVRWLGALAGARRARCALPNQLTLGPP